MSSADNKDELRRRDIRTLLDLLATRMTAAEFEQVIRGLNSDLEGHVTKDRAWWVAGCNTTEPID